MTTFALSLLLFVLGLAGMTLLPNLVRKLMAMNVMQSAVIVFFVALSYKRGGVVPIGYEGAAGALEGAAAAFMNPLPHTLMLTAIVVSVSTTGLALALLMYIRRRFGTLDENELLDRLR